MFFFFCCVCKNALGEQQQQQQETIQIDSLMDTMDDDLFKPHKHTRHLSSCATCVRQMSHMFFLNLFIFYFHFDKKIFLHFFLFKSSRATTTTTTRLRELQHTHTHRWCCKFNHLHTSGITRMADQRGRRHATLSLYSPAYIYTCVCVLAPPATPIASYTLYIRQSARAGGFIIAHNFETLRGARTVALWAYKRASYHQTRNNNYTPPPLIINKLLVWKKTTNLFF